MLWIFIGLVHRLVCPFWTCRTLPLNSKIDLGYWKLSLVGWVSSVRCNSGLSCVLVCCFAEDAAWMFYCFAKESDSTIADCVSDKLLIISFFAFSSICKNFILAWSTSKFLHWSLKTLTLFSVTSDNKSILLYMVETSHFTLQSRYLCFKPFYNVLLIVLKVIFFIWW